MMEVFAGYLEHTDHHIGRLIDFLDGIGELDNTLIMAISDNGASSEGGPNGSTNENKFFNNVPDDLQQNLAALNDLGGPKYFNHYAWGWAHAGDTPFRRWKRATYRGGVSDPYLVHWPKGINARDRHGANCSRSPRHRPARANPWCHPITDRGCKFRPHLRRRDGAQQTSYPVFRDVRA
jgi:arylsulfatase A-like enzyme